MSYKDAFKNFSHAPRMARSVGQLVNWAVKSPLLSSEPTSCLDRHLGPLTMTFVTPVMPMSPWPQRGPRCTQAICLQPWMSHSYSGKEATVPTYNTHSKRERGEVIGEGGAVIDEL